MKTNKKNSGINVNTGVKAGGFAPGHMNHNRNGLKVKAGIKSGALIRFSNHNRRLIALA
jgi:hypothetical protein